MLGARYSFCVLPPACIEISASMCFGCSVSLVDSPPQEFSQMRTAASSIGLVVNSIISESPHEIIYYWRLA